MNPRELLVLLARFTITGYGDPIALTEVFVYARDHRCPAAPVPAYPHSASRLAAV